MFTIPELLTLCFDQTTAKGEGGDKIQARYNSMAFNAALAPIQTAMANMKKQDPLVHGLLMYLHTEIINHQDISEIRQRMRFVFWLGINTKHMHQAHIDKVNDFLYLTLAYCKNSKADEKLNKEFIAKSLKIHNWYDKKRKIYWDGKFKEQLDHLAELEQLGFQFLQEASDEVERRLFKIDEQEVKEAMVRSSEACA